MKIPIKKPARRIWIALIVLPFLAAAGWLSYWGLSGAAAPPARYAAGMVFVPGEDRVYLFGGRYEGLFGTAYRNDLWTFDCQENKWSPIHTRRQPPARGNLNMVYDAGRHQIVLFGGFAKERFGDTWIYDIAQNAWREVTPATSPPPRSDAGMVYDAANDEVILFSGYGLEESRDIYADTWAYDPQMNTWTQVQPVSSPPLMYGQTMVYDSVHQQAFLWGGHASIREHGEVTSHWYEENVWRYDPAENTWEKLAYASTPPARYWHGAVFDEQNGLMVVFGGQGDRDLLDDTWIARLESHTWSRINGETAPSPRENVAMVYDSVHHVVILFGGLEKDLTDRQDTWILEMTETGGRWTQVNTR